MLTTRTTTRLVWRTELDLVHIGGGLPSIRTIGYCLGLIGLSAYFDNPQPSEYNIFSGAAQLQDMLAVQLLYLRVRTELHTCSRGILFPVATFMKYHIPQEPGSGNARAHPGTLRDQGRKGIIRRLNVLLPCVPGCWLPRSKSGREINKDRTAALLDAALPLARTYLSASLG